ncbi:MAG: AEC family transporter, partial [Desulfurobacteriaceae bacterium]
MTELLINVILPLYLLIFSGFVIGKLKPDLTTDTISFIVLYLFAPSLIFHSFRNVKLELTDFSCITLVALGVFVIVFLIALGVEIIFFKKRNEAFELSSTVMNAGYMGIPLIYLMFGEKVVSFATFYMVVMAIFHFTLGIVIL